MHTRIRTARLAVVIAALALTGAVAPASAAKRPRVPGALGVDHMGVTVPDVAKARKWFVGVLGCTAPLRFGPHGRPPAPRIDTGADKTSPDSHR